MNIFVLAEQPDAAARFHCDKHVVKMVLESVQLLCTAHHQIDGPDAPDGVYGTISNPNHPVAKWTRATSGNYLWTFALAAALGAQFYHRYHKAHASIALLPRLFYAPAGITLGPRTPFEQCMPDAFKGPDAVHAYRLFYATEKMRFARWRRGVTEPYWLEEYLALADAVKLTGFNETTAS